MSTPDLGTPPSPAAIVETIAENIPDIPIVSAPPDLKLEIKKSIFKNPIFWVGILGIVAFIYLKRKKPIKKIETKKEETIKEVKNESNGAIDWSRARGYNDNVKYFGVRFPSKRRSNFDRSPS